MSATFGALLRGRTAANLGVTPVSLLAHRRLACLTAGADIGRFGRATVTAGRRGLSNLGNYELWSPTKNDLKILERNQSKLKRKARNGDSFAQFSFGALLLMQEKKGEAARWIEKAAVKGHLDAEYTIGAMYLQGQGVEQNREKAAEYLAKSAQKGHTAALAVLGTAFVHGLNGFPKHEERGIALLKQAAVLKNPEAEFMLGALLANGHGSFERDPNAALQWMERAASSGHPIAKTTLPRLQASVEKRKMWSTSFRARLTFNIFMRRRGEPAIPLSGPDPMFSEDNPNIPRTIDAAFTAPLNPHDEHPSNGKDQYQSSSTQSLEPLDPVTSFEEALELGASGNRIQPEAAAAVRQIKQEYKSVLDEDKDKSLPSGRRSGS